MNTLVIDASIAVKWVVEEDGTPEPLALRQKARLIAPELLVAECADLALTVDKKCQLVTADKRLLRKLHQSRQHTLRGRAILLVEAVKL